MWLIKREGGGKQDLDGILAELEKQGLLSTSEVTEIKNNANNEIKIGSRTISFKLEEEDTIVKFEPEDPSLWQYEPDPATNGETLILKGYVGTGRPTEMRIPNYIGGKPIKKIMSKVGTNGSIWSGSGICENDGVYNATQTSVKKVYIPEGIEEIGAGTFMWSKALEEVVLPSTIQKIGEQAFKLCTALKNIDISMVYIIEDEAFAECTSLSEINIKAMDFTIGGIAFGGCTNLRKVNLGNRGKIEWYAFDRMQESNTYKHTIRSDANWTLNFFAYT